MTKYYKMTDLQGNIIEGDDSLLDIVFPPKAWMSDEDLENKLGETNQT